MGALTVQKMGLLLDCCTEDGCLLARCLGTLQEDKKLLRANLGLGNWQVREPQGPSVLPVKPVFALRLGLGNEEQIEGGKSHFG